VCDAVTRFNGLVVLPTGFILPCREYDYSCLKEIMLPGINSMTFLQGPGNGSIHMRDKPAKEKLEFFGTSFFIPIFF
jgi:hypothetical protein